MSDPDLIKIGEVEQVASCRICLERGEDDGYFCIPCNCLGSIRFLHPDCLKEWIKQSGSVQCQICHSIYKQRWSVWAYENNLIRSENCNQQEETERIPFGKIAALAVGLLLVFALVIMIIINANIQNRDYEPLIVKLFRGILVIMVLFMVVFTGVYRHMLGLNIIENIEE